MIMPMISSVGNGLCQQTAQDNLALAVPAALGSLCHEVQGIRDAWATLSVRLNPLTRVESAGPDSLQKVQTAAQPQALAEQIGVVAVALSVLRSDMEDRIRRLEI